MRKKRKTLGSLISTMVYLGGAVWLTYEATNLYFGNQLFKAFFVALGGFFSFWQFSDFKYKTFSIGVSTKNGNKLRIM